MDNMDIKRTQVWFNNSRLKRKLHTGKSWQYLLDIGIEYQEYLISVGEQEPSYEFKKTKDFRKPIAGVEE